MDTTDTTTARPSQTAEDTTTHDIAASEVSRQDPREFTITAFDQIRRKHTPYSRTNAIARGMVDSAEHYGDSIPHLAEDSPAMQIQSFARSVNASTFADTLPANASVDEIVDAIIRHGRESK